MKIKILTISIFIFSLLLAYNLCYSQNENDSCTKIIEQAQKSGKYDTSTIKILNKVFFENLKINNSKAAEIAAIGIQLATKNNDSLFLERMQNLRGMTILEQNSYPMALQIFFSTYEYFSRKNLKSDLANTLLLISQTYIEQNFQDIATDKILIAIDLFRQTGDSASIGVAYRLLGQTSIDFDNQKALKYFLYSKKLLEKNNNLTELAKTFFQLGNYYYQTDQTDLSIQYLTRSLQIFKQQQKMFELAQTYLYLGDIFSDQNLFTKAIYQYNLVKNIAKQFNLLKLRATANLKIAQCLLNQRDFFIAINYADSTISDASIINNNYLTSQAYNILSQCNFNLNKIQQAYQYSNLYAQYLSQYYEQEQSGNFSSFQMNLETQNKENELRLVKMNNEKQRLELIQKQYDRNIIFVVVILLLGLSIIIFVFFRLRERKKNALQLESTNEKLQMEVEDRKRAELESKTNEYRYKLLFNQSPIGILQFNENFHISEINGTIAEIFHVDAKEIINTHLNSIFDRKTVSQITSFFETKGEQTTTTFCEIPTIKEVVYISLTIKKYHIWENEQEFVGGIIIIQDLTEQKKFERYYTTNLASKQKLLKHLPDNLILLDKKENIVSIHFPHNPKLEVSASKLTDLFTEQIITLIRTNIINIEKSKVVAQFVFSDSSVNYLVRIIPYDNNNMLVISELVGEAEDAGIVIRKSIQTNNFSTDTYLRSIQNDIDKELIPVYHNIQRGLSFLMIKNFAEKIVQIGKKYDNGKFLDFGDKLLDSLTSFNIAKVNGILDNFPTFINEFITINNKF